MTERDEHPSQGTDTHPDIENKSWGGKHDPRIDATPFFTFRPPPPRQEVRGGNGMEFFAVAMLVAAIVACVSFIIASFK